MMTFFETMIADNFEKDFYVPNYITTIKLLLRRTAYTFGNLYHQCHKQSSTISNYKLQTTNFKQ